MLGVGYGTVARDKSDPNGSLESIEANKITTENDQGDPNGSPAPIAASGISLVYADPRLNRNTNHVESRRARLRAPIRGSRMMLPSSEA